MMRRLCAAGSVTLLLTTPAMAGSGMTQGQFFGVVVALLLICAGAGAWLIYSGLRSRNLAKASQTWPTAGAKILSSEVVTRTARTGKNNARTTYYRPEIRYAYKVGGADYEGSTIRFGDLESGSASLSQELVTKYAPGTVVTVKYDPQDPSRATLETRSAGGTQILTGIFFIVVPLIIAVIGGLIFSAGGVGETPPTDAAAPVEQAD